MAITNDWKNDPYIKKWFEIVNTERTLENYRRDFPKFLEFVHLTTEFKNPTPTQIIESRIQHLKSDDMNVRRFWEDVGIKYMHSLEDKEFRKNTIKTYLTPMQSFFSKNHVKLSYSRGELDPRPKGKGRGKAMSKEWIPDREDVKTLYRFGDSPRDRAILLTLFQSGVSEVDATNILIEDFDFFDDIGNWKIDTTQHLYWSNERSKSRELFQTCLSSEALEEIRIYLQSRGNPKEGNLFVSFRGEPLKTRDMNAIIKRIVEKAFNGRVKEWRTKNLRDGYMNALEQSKVPQKIADLMVGHKPSGAKSNYKVSEATIKMNYTDAFKFLSINGASQQAKKIEEIVTLYSEKEKADTERFRQLTDILTEIRAENKMQANRIEKLETRLTELGVDVNTINKTLPQIQKDIREQSIDILELQDKAKIKPKPIKDYP
jgi:site-specific recombinase XerD